MGNQDNNKNEFRKKFSIKKKQLAFAAFVIFLNFFTEKRVQAIKNDIFHEKKNSSKFFSIKGFFDEFEDLSDDEIEERNKQLNFEKRNDKNFFSNLFRFRLRNKICLSQKTSETKEKLKFVFGETEFKNLSKGLIVDSEKKLLNKNLSQKISSDHIDLEDDQVREKIEEIVKKITEKQDSFGQFHLEQFEKFLETFQQKLSLNFSVKKEKMDGPEKLNQKNIFKNWENKELDFWRILYFSFKKIKHTTKNSQSETHSKKNFQNNLEIFSRNSKKLKKINLAKLLPKKILAPRKNKITKHSKKYKQQFFGMNPLMFLANGKLKENKKPKKNIKIRKKILNELRKKTNNFKKIEHVKKILNGAKKSQKTEEINKKKEYIRKKSIAFVYVKLKLKKYLKKIKKRRVWNYYSRFKNNNKKKPRKKCGIKKFFYKIHKQPKNTQKKKEEKNVQNLTNEPTKLKFRKKEKLKNPQEFWQLFLFSLNKIRINKKVYLKKKYKKEKKIKNIVKYLPELENFYKIVKKKYLSNQHFKKEKKFGRIKKIVSSKKLAKIKKKKSYKNEIKLIVKKKSSKMVRRHKKKILFGKYKKKKRIFKLKPKHETKARKNKIFRVLIGFKQIEKTKNLEQIFGDENLQTIGKFPYLEKIMKIYKILNLNKILNKNISEYPEKIPIKHENFKKIQKNKKFEINHKALIAKRKIQLTFKKKKAYSAIEKKPKKKNKGVKAKKKKLRRSKKKKNFHFFYLNENINEGEKTRTKKIKTNLGQTILGGITVIEIKEFSDKQNVLSKKNPKIYQKRIISQKNSKCFQCLNNLSSNNPDSKSSLSLLLGTKELKKWNDFHGVVLFDPSRGFLTEIFALGSGSVFLKHFLKYKKTIDYDSTADVMNKIKILTKNKSLIFKKKSKKTKKKNRRINKKKKKFKRFCRKIKFELCSSHLKKRKNHTSLVFEKKKIRRRLKYLGKIFFVSRNRSVDKYFIVQDLTEKTELLNFQKPKEKNYKLLKFMHEILVPGRNKKFKSTLYKIKKKTNKNKKIKKKNFPRKRFEKYKKKLLKFIKKIKPKKRRRNKIILKPQPEIEKSDEEISTVAPKIHPEHQPEIEKSDEEISPVATKIHLSEEWAEITINKHTQKIKNKSNLIFFSKNEPIYVFGHFFENFLQHTIENFGKYFSEIILNDFVGKVLESNSNFDSFHQITSNENITKESWEKLLVNEFENISKKNSKNFLNFFSNSELENGKKNIIKNILENIQKNSKFGFYDDIEILSQNKILENLMVGFFNNKLDEFEIIEPLEKKSRKNFPFFQNSFSKIEKKFLCNLFGNEDFSTNSSIFYSKIFSKNSTNFKLIFHNNFVSNLFTNEKMISYKKFSLNKEQSIYPTLLLSKTSNLRNKKKGIKRIGKSFLKGRAIPRCFIESSKYFSKFSKIKKRKKRGLYRLAKFFFKGKGIGRNKNISFSILKKTGKKGNNKSVFDCASILTRGFGLQYDFNRATSLVQKIGKKKKN